MTDKTNPSHYRGFSNGAQVIDIIERLNYNRGAAIKYTARAGRKHGESALDDLRKSQWHLEREINRIVNDGKETRHEIERILADGKETRAGAELEPTTSSEEFPPTFADELTMLIAWYGIGKDSDTPYPVLAEYLLRCLDAFMLTVSDRDAARITSIMPSDETEEILEHVPRHNSECRIPEGQATDDPGMDG